MFKLSKFKSSKNYNDLRTFFIIADCICLITLLLFIHRILLFINSYIVSGNIRFCDNLRIIWPITEFITIIIRVYLLIADYIFSCIFLLIFLPCFEFIVILRAQKCGDRFYSCSSFCYGFQQHSNRFLFCSSFSFYYLITVCYH